MSMELRESGSLVHYNSLTDPHLVGFFASAQKRQQLLKAGLITRDGEVLSEATYRLNVIRASRQGPGPLLDASSHPDQPSPEGSTNSRSRYGPGDGPGRASGGQSQRRGEEIPRIEVVYSDSFKGEQNRGGRQENATLPRLHLSPSRDQQLCRLSSSRSPSRDQQLYRLSSSRSADEIRKEEQGTRAVSAPAKLPSPEMKRSARFQKSQSPSHYRSQSQSLNSCYNLEESTENRKQQQQQQQLSRSARGSSSKLSERPASSPAVSKDEVNGPSTGTAERWYGVSPYLWPLAMPPDIVPLPQTRPRPKTTGTMERQPGNQTSRSKGGGGPDLFDLKIFRLPTAAASQKTFSVVTLHYYGSYMRLSDMWLETRDEVMIEQQHCGGNTLIVYKDRITPETDFSFVSHRHRGYPFSLTFYVNGRQYCRLSTCCECKFSPGVRLGGKRGQFGLVSVENRVPCSSRCEMSEEQRSASREQEKRKQPKRPKTTDGNRQNDPATTATTKQQNADNRSQSANAKTGKANRQDQGHSAKNKTKSKTSEKTESSDENDVIAKLFARKAKPKTETQHEDEPRPEETKDENERLEMFDDNNLMEPRADDDGNDDDDGVDDDGNENAFTGETVDENRDGIDADQNTADNPDGDAGHLTDPEHLDTKQDACIFSEAEGLERGQQEGNSAVREQESLDTPDVVNCAEVCDEADDIQNSDVPELCPGLENDQVRNENIDSINLDSGTSEDSNTADKLRGEEEHRGRDASETSGSVIALDEQPSEENRDDSVADDDDLTKTGAAENTAEEEENVNVNNQEGNDECYANALNTGAKEDRPTAEPLYLSDGDGEIVTTTNETDDYMKVVITKRTAGKSDKEQVQQASEKSGKNAAVSSGKSKSDSKSLKSPSRGKPEPVRKSRTTAPRFSGNKINGKPSKKNEVADENENCDSAAIEKLLQSGVISNDEKADKAKPCRPTTGTSSRADSVKRSPNRSATRTVSQGPTDKKTGTQGHTDKKTNTPKDTKASTKERTIATSKNDKRTGSAGRIAKKNIEEHETARTSNTAELIYVTEEDANTKDGRNTEATDLASEKQADSREGDYCQISYAVPTLNRQGGGGNAADSTQERAIIEAAFASNNAQRDAATSADQRASNAELEGGECDIRRLEGDWLVDDNDADESDNKNVTVYDGASDYAAADLNANLRSQSDTPNNDADVDQQSGTFPEEEQQTGYKNETSEEINVVDPDITINEGDAGVDENTTNPDKIVETNSNLFGMNQKSDVSDDAVDQIGRQSTENRNQNDNVDNSSKDDNVRVFSNSNNSKPEITNNSGSSNDRALDNQQNDQNRGTEINVTWQGIDNTNEIAAENRGKNTTMEPTDDVVKPFLLPGTEHFDQSDEAVETNPVLMPTADVIKEEKPKENVEFGTKRRDDASENCQKDTQKLSLQHSESVDENGNQSGNEKGQSLASSLPMSLPVSLLKESPTEPLNEEYEKQDIRGSETEDATEQVINHSETETHGMNDVTRAEEDQPRSEIQTLVLPETHDSKDIQDEGHDTDQSEIETRDINQPTTREIEESQLLEQSRPTDHSEAEDVQDENRLKSEQHHVTQPETAHDRCLIQSNAGGLYSIEVQGTGEAHIANLFENKSESESPSQLQTVFRDPQQNEVEVNNTGVAGAPAANLTSNETSNDENSPKTVDVQKQGAEDTGLSSEQGQKAEADDNNIYHLVDPAVAADTNVALAAADANVGLDATDTNAGLDATSTNVSFDTADGNAGLHAPDTNANLDNVNAEQDRADANADLVAADTNVDQTVVQTQATDKSNEIKAISTVEFNEILETAFRKGKNIEICNAELTRQQVERLATRLRDVGDVTSVTLRGVGLTDDGLKRISESFDLGNGLKNINLDNNCITSDGIAHLTALVKNSIKLETLSLHENPIGDEGIRALSTGLMQIGASSAGKMNLKKLDIGSCNLTTTGARHIGQLLRANVGLRSLSLTGNKNVSVGGWAAIGNALQANVQLTTLELFHNALGDDGISALYNGLASCKTISVVDLEGNRITDEGGLKIVGIIKASASLKLVKVLDGNRIGEEISQQIESVLRERK